MILLAGATGLVGGMIARALLARQEPVRVLVRAGSPYQSLVEAGAEPALGDLKEPTTLAAACRGARVVVTTASSGQRGGADDSQSVDLEGNRALIEAARAAGVEQFVYVSALTATADHPVPLPRAKAQAEEILRTSRLRHTIVAANGIMDVMFPLVIGAPLRIGRPVTLIRDGTRRHSFVAARDVAALSVAAIDHPAARDRRVPLGGPEALCWRDIVGVYEKVLGRPVPVRWIAPGELLPDLPPVPGLTELVSGLLAGLETFESPVDMTDTARTFGLAPTSAEDFVRASLAEGPR